MCTGCYNDFYNHGGVNGNTKECWLFEDAVIVKKKKVHIDQMPPWKQKATNVLSCRAEQRYVFVDEEC